MNLDTYGKKWAWVYAKPNVFEVEDPYNPVFGFKTMPSGDKDFILRVYNCPKTNEILEVYENSKTVVRFLKRGIYPLDYSRRNKALVEVTFTDGVVLTVDYADLKKRRLYSRIVPIDPPLSLKKFKL